jgi:hypothetical protein
MSEMTPMGVLDLFSKRQKRKRGDVPDVYEYDSLPDALRTQIVHIWNDSLGDEQDYARGYNGSRGAYQFIVDALCREYGVFMLPGVDEFDAQDFRRHLAIFFLKVSDHEKVLDAVELSFRYIDRVTRDYDYLSRSNANKIASDAIDELNVRFREHGVGYEYSDGEIIRVDSQFVHAEVVKVALTVLRGTDFQGAQAEFLKAHEHYRRGNGKEALAECLKSFESAIKIICKKRQWPHDPKATSSALIQILFDKELVPKFWAQHFSSLRSMLESGIPTVRNRLGGHGQGAQVVEVPDHIVSYALHMTASTIVFLAEANRKLP